jgi:translation initiation factor 2B subunit (eIF-2B alpha/beta/delta family)
MAAASLAECVQELRGARTHGGSWMARQAVEALLEVAREDAASGQELVERLIAAGRELAASRPAVAGIAGAVGRLLAAAERHTHLSPKELRRLVEEEGQALISSRDRAARSIAIQLRPRLENAFVLTHSASATVREALLHTPPEHVSCTLSAPYEEGRPFAEELRAAGLSVDLVEDAFVLEALEASSLLLLGADTVFQNGWVCNKVGTARLAEEANRLAIPTLVACEVIKLAPIDATDVPTAGEGERTFDMTPAEHVDAIVTEEGSYGSDEVRSLVDRTPFLSQGYALLARR